ncbi:MAG: histidine kinase dimerization/phospho-acceptor domain-containing protein, partial [Anaerolineae bacterium]|nr:histidine kinase dimerization/phospho-acceptor domain-containing protein [Anaerolineae bacterium]
MKWFNHPWKTSLLSLVATEVFVIIAKILLQTDITFEALAIAGIAAFSIPLIFNLGVVGYKKRIESHNSVLQLLTDELQTVNATLKSQNRELDEFAQTVAHDLKTPLTAILGFSEILSAQYDELDPETITHSLLMVASSARKALRIVDELLLLAHVSQDDEIVTGPLDMQAIVTEAQHRLEYLQSEFHATIRTPESWPVAVGHPGWVEEVWVNYISNAIKYGGENPIITLGS